MRAGRLHCPRQPLGSHWWSSTPLAILVNFKFPGEWLKNKAHLDSIYRMGLLKSRKVVDTLFHSGEILELVVLDHVTSYLQTGYLH